MGLYKNLWNRWLAFALLLVAAASVSAQPRRAADEGQYQIREARYGTAERNVEVTRRLQELARSDQQFRITNDTFAVDPDPGRVKTLRIFARDGRGEERMFEYAEGGVVDGVWFTGWRSGEWGQGGAPGGWQGVGGGGGGGFAQEGEYRILQALYGTSRRNVDVTRRLRELARADATFRMGNDTFGVDPDEGRIKTLRIYTRGPRGESKMFEYREGSVIDGARFSGWRGGDWGGGKGGGWGRATPANPPAQAAPAAQPQIVRAVYGAGNRMHDVTDRLRAVMARDGRIDLVVDNDSMGGDPADGVVKTLSVTLSDGRTQRQVAVRENGRLRLP